MDQPLRASARDQGAAAHGPGGSEAELLGAAAVLDQIAEGVIVTDQQGRIVLVNQAAARIHGVKRLDVDPDHYSEAYHLLTLDGAPHPPETLPLTRAVKHGETVVDARWRIVRPDGSEVLAIGTARPLFDGDGAQKGAILTVRDDTARHQAERDLAESEARFRAMADSAPAPIWVTNQGGIEFANKALEEFAGLSGADLLGPAWTSLIHPDDLPLVWQRRTSAWATHKPYEFEARFRRADGEWRWLQTSSNPRFDAAGALLGYVGIAADVTEARRAEAELRESEQRFRGVADSAPVLVWMSGVDKGMVWANKAWLDHTGRPLARELGEGWLESVHPDDLPALGACMEAFEQRRPFGADFRLRRHDGEWRWMQDTGIPRFDANGGFLGFIGSCVDITERHGAEDALRESEERYRSLFDFLDAGFCIVEIKFDAGDVARDYRFLEVNPAFERQTGIADAAGKWMREIAPAHEQHWYDIYGRVALTGEPARFEQPATALGDRWYDVHAFRIGAPEQRRVAILFNDISERRRTEQALRESEERLRIVQAAGGIGSFDYDLQKDDAVCSPEYYQLFGLPEGHPINRESWHASIHPDDLDEAAAALDRAIAERRPFDYEYRIRRADTGEIRWLSGRAAVIFDADDRPWRYVGGNIDITNRVAAEQALRERAEEMQTILDAVPAAIWIARDPESREIVGNRASYELLRIEEGLNASLSAGEAERPAGFRIFSGGRELAPEELPVQRAASGETVEHFEEEVRFDDGASVSLYGNAVPLRDGEGRVRGGVAAFVDVTDRHQAEEALRESEERFRAMADNISQFAWMANPDGWIFWYNRRWYDYTGTDLEAMQGWGWRDVHHPDHVERVTAKFAAAIAAGELWEDIFPLRSRDGEYRWFLSRARPIRDESGRIVRWFGTNTDITEEQRYQQHLKLLVDELNHRVKNTLAIVQSLAHQTFRNEGVSGEARRAFEGRLEALATAHNLLTRENWESADLGDIVAGALHAHRDGDGRFDYDGPPLRLEPKTAVTIAMALHELCTNATKYGALGAPGGRVTIRWTIDGGDAPRLHMSWRESGGPPVTPPARRGFGSRMIERALAGDLRGTARLDFQADGLVCEIDAPLPAGATAGGGDDAGR